MECKREGVTVSRSAKLETGARFLKMEVLLEVEGAGERSSISSSSEKSSFRTDSSSAPADDEPDTEEDR
jgi:hypothetical protein